MKAALDKAALVVVAILVKTLFTTYKLLAWPLVPVAVLLALWLGYLAFRDFSEAKFALSGVVLVSIYGLYYYDAERTLPASVGAGGWANRLADRFIAWLGTVKFFTSPPCLVEDPGSYRIKGTDIRALVDGDHPILRPGDILLRGYDGYLDGELIRRTGGASGPGRFLSHAALYVGDLDDARDREIAARRLRVMDPDGRWRDATEAEKDRFRNDPGYFQPGKQMVIHSMAKGVHVEDILTFVRCDYLVVLRLPDAIELSPHDLENHPLVELRNDALSIDRKLTGRQTVTRDEIVAAARDSALGRIGTGYDFLFDSCKTAHKFSCSEFVYYCYKSVHRYIGLIPKEHSFAGFFKRTTISPADVYAACEPGGKLTLAWSNVPADG